MIFFIRALREYREDDDHLMSIHMDDVAQFYVCTRFRNPLHSLLSCIT